VLWIHARVVTYAVCQQLETRHFFFFFLFLPTSRFGSKAFGEVLWERGSGGEIISARWEFLRRLVRVCRSLVMRLNDARHPDCRVKHLGLAGLGIRVNG
jgi:hypothetical protein